MAERGRRNPDALALALAGGATVRDAARTVGMAERTAYRLSVDPAFRRRVLQLRGEMTGRAAGALADGMSAAVQTLRDLLSAGKEGVRLNAAKAILQLSAELGQIADLEQRIRDLEEETKGGTDAAPGTAYSRSGRREKGAG
jgi:hypothetical protein